MPSLDLFAIFHLNLAYSSIEPEQHAEVVEKCYWPLLKLAADRDLPFGIEASVFTLEAAAAVDQSWLDELRRLVTQGPCEFVGAGYSQLIGPLVPASVNAANLRLGNEGYDELLGVRPAIALVNEQAYSAGLLQNYIDAGYEAVFMEWNNAARFNTDWDPEWRYLPQIASGQHGERLPVIWNKSASFQKFQHYAHGEIELDEYVDYLSGHAADTQRVLPLYGNDIEIFDYRPGRYDAEAKIAESEWARIGRVLDRIEASSELGFVSPSQVLGFLDAPGGGNQIHLETPELPVPVKKQGKYNITRWAVSGRDDLGINTRCGRLASALESTNASPDDWRELCYLWSSDFRTHITQGRWDAYLDRLGAFEKKHVSGSAGNSATTPETTAPGDSSAAEVSRDGRFLTVATQSTRVVLNTRRGLTIKALGFASLGPDHVVGTLEHGYFDDITMTADYYTGHLVYERPGAHKVTDLSPVEPEVTQDASGVVVRAVVDTPPGPVTKVITISKSQERVSISYEFDWQGEVRGSLRLGHITLDPAAFDQDTLYYATHNGGAGIERFELGGREVNHAASVSMLVSAAAAVGITEGVVELGDANNSLRIEVDRDSAALVGQVVHQRFGDQLFCRLVLSALELDETRKGEALFPVDGPIRFSIMPKTVREDAGDE